MEKERTDGVERTVRVMVLVMADMADGGLVVVSKDEKLQMLTCEGLWLFVSDMGLVVVVSEVNKSVYSLERVCDCSL